MHLIETHLSIRPLTSALAVSPQLQPQDMVEVARIGFKSVIINLPDYELGNEQPTAELIIKAAKEVGLSIVYQPVITTAITAEDTTQFGEWVNELPHPILAFCRSGNRCNMLFTQWQTV